MHETAVSATGSARARVVIANRRDGGLVFWLVRLYGFGLLVLVAGVLLSALLAYSYFSLNAPAVPDLHRYARVVPAVSRMYAADGTKLGEFAREWREVVPLERMPQRLIDAFLAVEDHDFYHHGGLYWKGIGRAVWANLTAGDFAQGGSTITQQVAKQFLGSEK
ncbi:MAG TPA: transglycosylase domain-containing protein, partial [Kofleriaceae bacterium]